eukprot:10979155-Ditylum_brightwellii.AAC.1
MEYTKCCTAWRQMCLHARGNDKGGLERSIGNVWDDLMSPSKDILSNNKSSVPNTQGTVLIVIITNTKTS